MMVHLFGASSPSCSNFALRVVKKNLQTLKKNFFVNDALKSVPTEKICARGKVIMSELPKDRAKEIKGLDFG